MNAALTLTVLAVVALLVAEYWSETLGVWIAKPIASAGFVAFALACGAMATGYGRAVLVALVLSWVGDVALIPKNPRAFQFGIGAFLLGHLAFIAAFALRGASLLWAAGALMVLSAPAFAVAKRILPRAPEALRIPVAGYIAVISTMVAFSAGTVAVHGGRAIALGAVTFFLSDLSVARDRFVAPGFANKLWGLPLYYGAQLALGWSTGH